MPRREALAHVDGALNAVAIQGEMVGRGFLSGVGAGAGPTATSDLSARYDLRFTVRDAGDEGFATIAILTHDAREGEVRASLNAIDETQLTTAPTHLIRIVE